ncbi:amino acid ABC transporter permease [Ancylobacter defluvii]|uniref:Amino acid ABC transporter n=1 Tax=Ancylobacter defluvii TaxID=1282440 RepID=A0A9W6N9R9_9HYPH|nr:amino acid ABC transporter permease [Ancylobacter defluvii]MBS7590166.1 amino acid ABC transporter permease [Ancylobacter defluvii]GLK82797.1 amino acid ABC transporter [Ancylobacter defluvii]
MQWPLTYHEKKRVVQLAIVLALAGWIAADALLGGAAYWQRVWLRLPLLLTGSGSGWPLTGGFALNIFLGLGSMALAAIMGTLLAFGMMAKSRLVRLPCFFVMNFLRNSPWLVLLFAMLYIIPFNVRLFGVSIAVPAFVKAVIGLSLPTAANFAEIIRGAVQSIHSGQWEAARALGYMPMAIYSRIILPQALRRMIPGWMNLYALLMIATSLATVTGIQDVLTTLNTLLSMENERVIVYFYITTLFLFFAYCYPIALLARRMEQSVKGDTL